MTTTAPARAGARERILEAAYELFTRRSIREVGINDVIARAKVTKSTFYYHFPSKDELVVRFLQLREQRVTIEWLQAQVQTRGHTPTAQLLAVFDTFDEWFRDAEFDSCPFIHTLLEMGPDHPIGQASLHHLRNVRKFLGDLARKANLRDPESFARAFHLLMKGSIVAAVEGDIDAARLAKNMARALIEEHESWAAIADVASAEARSSAGSGVYG